MIKSWLHRNLCISVHVFSCEVYGFCTVHVIFTIQIYTCMHLHSNTNIYAIQLVFRRMMFMSAIIKFFLVLWRKQNKNKCITYTTAIHSKFSQILRLCFFNSCVNSLNDLEVKMAFSCRCW